jgi:hypothetical protein
LSPAQRRDYVKHAVTELGVSERFACKVLGQPRATQRKTRLRDEFLNGEIFYTLQEPKSSSKLGAASTTPFDRTLHSGTGRQRQRFYGGRHRQPR